MNAQPQLLDISLSPTDIVYTPDWAAQDIVSFFQPTGKVLDPCAGDGAFLRYLPDGSEWCEIEKGRDFFAWTKQVDWIVSNPPYTIFDEWLDHSFEVSTNSVYLMAPGRIFVAHGRLKRINALGWIKHIRFYGTGNKLGFPGGAAFAAVHFVRGYHGDTSWSWYERK